MFLLFAKILWIFPFYQWTAMVLSQTLYVWGRSLKFNRRTLTGPGYSFTAYAPKIKSVEINLGRDVPSPARYLGNFFTLESVKNNLGSGFSPKWTMPKRKVVFWDSFPYTPLNWRKTISGISQPVWNGVIYMFTPGLYFSVRAFKKSYLPNPNCTRPAQTDFGAKAVWEEKFDFQTQ